MNRLDVLDWRRRVAALYDVVRRCEPEEGHARWRQGRDELFATHPASPLQAVDRAGFRTLPIADYDPAFRFEVPVEEADAETRDVVTGTDGTVRFQRIGRVRIGALGRLDVWWLDQYGGGLFLPVKDPGGSYGGGRYVLDTVKGADLGGRDGSLVVDLNFAYPPSCAYDPTWACPLAPPGNTVAVPIPVGEQSGSWSG